MRKIAAVIIGIAAAVSLTACGAATTGNKVITVQTPDGPVTCVVVSSNGNGAGVSCNWDKVNGK